MGEPDFDTPNGIVDAAKKALDRGQTHYTHSLGILELREAIAEHYHIKYRTNVTPNQIVVTSGTCPTMLLVFSAILNPADEVVCINPGYAC